jgi:hypothetical protein
MTKTRGRPVSSDLINWDTVALGKKSDKDIAESLNVSAPSVRKQRIKRNIPCFPKRAWDVNLIGTMSDEAIARLVGRSSSTINEARWNLGLPPSDTKYKTTEGENASLPEAIIDLYWHENGIAHKFQYKVGRYIADWLIQEDTIVEYAGLAAKPFFGAHYNERLATKKILYQQKGYNILIILPTDLDKYDTKQPLHIVDSLLPKHLCPECGIELYRQFESQFRKTKSAMCKSCAAKNRDRDYSDMCRENNVSWRGGLMRSRGYVYVLRADHPRANKHGYVKRVNLIMEDFLNRYLEKDEIVRFIDSNRANEKLDNLEIVTKSQLCSITARHSNEKKWGKVYETVN